MENVINRVRQCISLDERTLTGVFLRRDFIVMMVVNRLKTKRIGVI
jgi:hypothetical protein